MYQYNTGITSTLKKDKQFRPLIAKSKKKKLSNSYKPKNPKAQLISKNNPISPQTQISNKNISVEESYRKTDLQQKKNTYIQNGQKQSIKISNKYLNEHLGMSNSKNSMKIFHKDKPETVHHHKKLQKENKQSKEKLQITKKQTSSISTENLLRAQLNSHQNYNMQINNKYKNQNKILYQNQYKQNIHQIKESNQVLNKIRPRRSISSSSSQSKQSYYGIVAQYRRKKLKNQQFSQGKCSLQNSVSLTGSAPGQYKLMNRVKSQDFIPITGSLNGELFKNKINSFHKIRPRIGTSVESKQSIKSSQSNLSSSSRNPFEQKVRIMKEHLKLRKCNLDLDEKELIPKKKIQNHHHINEIILDQSFIFQNDLQEQKCSKQSQLSLLKYKQLYKNSIDKIKNVTKQLEIQKKKNQLTKQIYKSEINKLKRIKSLEQLNQNKEILTNLTNFERQDKIDKYQMQQKCINSSFYGEVNNINKGTSSINYLKDKLKNSHLFSYQDYQGVTHVGNSNQFKKSLNTQQVNENSILRPNQDFLSHNNQSNDMIVEMSAEWKDSAFLNSSLGKSKFSNAIQMLDYSLQDDGSKNNQRNIYSNANKEQLLFTLGRNKPQQQQQVKNSQVPFKRIDQVIVNEIKDESMLLDISSNLNNTKNSNLDVSKSQRDIFDSLGTDKILQSQQIQKKSNNFINIIQNDKNIQEKENKIINKTIKQQKRQLDIKQQKQQVNIKKRIPIIKRFAQDIQLKQHQKYHQSEYQSTSSSTVLRSKYNTQQNSYFIYQ